jgi:ubiquinone/menaquinone biosynthesis C-methylase UbiE
MLMTPMNLWPGGPAIGRDRRKAHVDSKPGTSMADIQKLYALRFADTGLDKRKRVWRVLCDHFFNGLIDPDSTVLDLACGYGEFINNVRCGRKLAVDLNPDAQANLDAGIVFYQGPATDLKQIEGGSVDTVFTSNFLEHLSNKGECDRVFSEIWRILKENGRFIVMGPNIKYAFKVYWDYYDHTLPLSDMSVAEGLRQRNFAIERVIPRFLPYTMNNSRPTADIIVQIYLHLPVAWRIFGKQFLVIARKMTVPSLAVP